MIATEQSHLTEQRLRQWLDLVEDDSDGEIESHLETCEQCAALLEALRPDQHALVQRIRELSRSESTLETVTEPTGTESTAATTTPSMTHAGRWTLLELLTVGGIGEIWIARDELLGRKVAVKRLRQQTAHMEMVQARFIYEARITARLNHPGIVHIFDLIEDGPRSYYSMSLINGQTLQELIADFHNRRINSRINQHGEFLDLLRVWCSVARTIAFAHSQNVLHRDIKSENIIVGEFGEVTVLDWGLAKHLEDRVFEQDTFIGDMPHQVRQTRHGARLGTPAFMSPEQARGDIEHLDERTDNYSLAALLYELLTGQTPFLASDVESMVEQVLRGVLIEPRDIAAFVPEKLNELCLKGLARDRDERFQLASDFADQVEEWLNSESLRVQNDLARQKLFDLSSDLMVMFDSTPKIQWVNAAWERSLGWTLDDLMGLKPNILVHPEDLKSGKQMFDELDAGATATGLERRIQAVDGSYHWFSWTVTPIVDEAMTVAIGRNVDELIRRRDEFASVLEATPEALLVVNLDHTIHRVNRRLLELFGYREADLVGQRIDTLVPQRHHDALQRFFENYLSNIETKPLMSRDQLTGRRKDGSQFLLGIRCQPVDSEKGIRIVVSIRQLDA